MRILIPTIILAALSAAALAQNESKPIIDPQTGRAIGAKEISPQELKKHIDHGTKMLMIDVREPADFEKETIKGAINIPLGQLDKKLREMPKDTLLAFT